MTSASSVVWVWCVLSAVVFFVAIAAALWWFRVATQREGFAPKREGFAAVDNSMGADGQRVADPTLCSAVASDVPDRAFTFLSEGLAAHPSSTQSDPKCVLVRTGMGLLSDAEACSVTPDMDPKDGVWTNPLTRGGLSVSRELAGGLTRCVVKLPAVQTWAQLQALDQQLMIAGADVRSMAPQLVKSVQDTTSGLNRAMSSIDGLSVALNASSANAVTASGQRDSKTLELKQLAAADADQFDATKARVASGAADLKGKWDAYIAGMNEQLEELKQALESEQSKINADKGTIDGLRAKILDLEEQLRSANARTCPVCVDCPAPTTCPSPPPPQAAPQAASIKAVGSPPSLNLKGTESGTVDLSQYYTGSGIAYSLSNPGYNANATISGSNITVTAQNRNMTYDVYFTLKSTGGEEVKGQISVTETAAAVQKVEFFDQKGFTGTMTALGVGSHDNYNSFRGDSFASIRIPKGSGLWVKVFQNNFNGYATTFSEYTNGGEVYDLDQIWMGSDGGSWQKQISSVIIGTNDQPHDSPTQLQRPFRTDAWSNGQHYYAG
jgi:hypothetical protein